MKEFALHNSWLEHLTLAAIAVTVECQKEVYDEGEEDVYRDTLVYSFRHCQQFNYDPKRVQHTHTWARTQILIK